VKAPRPLRTLRPAAAAGPGTPGALTGATRCARSVTARRVLCPCSPAPLARCAPPFGTPRAARCALRPTCRAGLVQYGPGHVWGHARRVRATCAAMRLCPPMRCDDCNKLTGGRVCCLPPRARAHERHRRVPAASCAAVCARRGQSALCAVPAVTPVPIVRHCATLHISPPVRFRFRRAGRAVSARAHPCRACSVSEVPALSLCARCVCVCAASRLRDQGFAVSHQLQPRSQVGPLRLHIHARARAHTRTHAHTHARAQAPICQRPLLSCRTPLGATGCLKSPANT
jgi:hypothetical protein